MIEPNIEAWRSAFALFEASEHEAAALRESIQSLELHRAEMPASTYASSLSVIEDRITRAETRAARAFSDCGDIATRVLYLEPETPAQALAFLEIRRAHVIRTLKALGCQAAMVADVLDRTRADFARLYFADAGAEAS